MTNTKSFIVLVAASLAALAAQAAPLNPLVRPNSAPPGAPAKLAGPRIPAPPQAPGLLELQAPADEKTLQNSLTVTRTALSRFTVVSIVGDMAALRMVPNLVPLVVGGGGQGQSQGGQFGQQPGSSGVMGGTTSGVVGSTGAAGANSNTTQAKVYPSLLLKSGQSFVLGDLELTPQVVDSQVWIRTKDGTRVVFYSRLDSASLGDRSKVVKLEAADSGYVTKYSPEPSVSGTATATSTSGSTSTSAGATGVVNSASSTGAAK